MCYIERCHAAEQRAFACAMPPLAAWCAHPRRAFALNVMRSAAGGKKPFMTLSIDVCRLVR
jgi:hypothetical protein